MSWPKYCARCDHLIYPMSWMYALGWSHGGRGLCDPCWRRCRRNGELADYEPLSYSRGELMTEWELLRLEGYSKRQAAARLGLTLKTFNRAFHRARRAGDPRAVPGVPEREKAS